MRGVERANVHRWVNQDVNIMGGHSLVLAIRRFAVNSVEMWARLPYILTPLRRQVFHPFASEAME